MTLVEYLNKLKDERNLTLAQIADISGVPVATVQRIMSGSTENPAFQAVVDMIKALGGSVDEYAEIVKREEESQEKVVVRYVRDTTYEDRLIEIFRRQLRDKNRFLIVLATILTVILFAAVSLLIYDYRNGDIGYIRYLASQGQLYVNKLFA